MVDRADLLGDAAGHLHAAGPLPQFYGLPGRDVGLQFGFKYRVCSAGPTIESRFFKYLTDIGKPGDPTAFQLAYNDQVSNVLDVTAPVLYSTVPRSRAG